MKTQKNFRPFVAAIAAALLGGALAGCAPLLVGGAAVGTALMVTDRRTSGAQIDDEAIELRSASRLREAFGDRAHINVNSYNRQVLLTGEVPSEAAKQQAEQIVGRVDNVRGIVNELAVMAPTTLPQRSGDTLITGKVRASFVDASDLQANAFRVVTERGSVYLMGRVSQREADRATSIARQIAGVQRVVRIFEVVDATDLRQLAPVSTGTPATVAPAPAPAPAAAPAGGAVVTPVR
ncbi:BON domain-containing protein [Ramlibacter pallidus]|uniref:BON domain-containing protein n=1 Tax=Ramlibacter pallidus TaxID=2780087 RepID=A0ABR9S0J1_9BURK|nr:BON domain-containing protein [Ramlibacter pallidus]MBE7366990.1 BON domain-containing protein [Ramlibacter pallidus]